MMPDPAAALVSRLGSAGFDPRPTGPDSWESRCPAHNGSRRNLSIRRGDDGRALVHCHHADEAGGCDHRAILAALGLAEGDLFPPGDPAPSGTRPRSPAVARPKARTYSTPENAIEATTRKLGAPTASWTYPAADGSEAMRVYRFDPPEGRKEYRPVHPTPEGWALGDPPGPLPLYHVPDLAGAGRIYLLEGEKCCDRARDIMGVAATTTAHGAKSPHKSDLSPLSGKEVVILPDADPAGEAYAGALVGLLAMLDPRPTVKVVRLADLWRTLASMPEGSDIDDWLRDGVPDQWEPEQCRAELERLADLAPVEGIDATALGPLRSGETPPATTTRDRPRVKLTRASDVICRVVDWLWPGRVPLGMLTMFAGDPKLGKSLVTMWLAAQVTRGVCPGPPDVGTEPRSALLLSAEDDPSRTIVPRLKAAGADLARVHILEAVYLPDGSEALPSLKIDIDAIDGAIGKAGDCSLVIIDPVSAYLGGADDHRNAELRGVLSPLKVLAERWNVAVVLVSHLNKAGGTNAMYRVAGSIAYTGAARSNLLFVKDRDDPTGRRVLMGSAGGNLCAAPPTLAYRIIDDGAGPILEWEPDPVDITPEAALSAQGADPEARAEQAECVDWLRGMLADGRVLQTVIATDGRAAGFSPDQLKRAKRRIGAKSHRDGFGKGSQCHWEMPRAAP